MARPALVVLIAAVGACATASGGAGVDPAEGERREVVTVTDSVEVTMNETDGGLARFVPNVPALMEGGQCLSTSDDMAEPGESVLVLAFPDTISSLRNVSLTYGSDGELKHYSDSRGDLRHPDWIASQGGSGAKRGSFTSVGINFEQGTAFAMNEGGGKPSSAALGAASEALTMKNLGEPSRMIALIRARCGNAP